MTAFNFYISNVLYQIVHGKSHGTATNTKRIPSHHPLGSLEARSFCEAPCACAAMLM